MLKILILAFAFVMYIMQASCHSVSKQKSHIPVSSSFTHRAINSSVASPKPLADELGYWIGMRLSFKPIVTCRPIRNLWFVKVFSTFRHQNSVVKIGIWLPLFLAPPFSHGTNGTMFNPALETLWYIDIFDSWSFEFESVMQKCVCLGSFWLTLQLSLCFKPVYCFVLGLL